VGGFAACAVIFVSGLLVAAVLANRSEGRTATVPTFALSAGEASNVATAVQFIHAFNAKKLSAAMSLLTMNAVVSDCDYRGVRAVQFSGRAQIARWLRQRFADHDQLVVESAENANPDSDAALGITWSRRKSDTLRGLGFPSGIVPKFDAKVVFSPAHRIDRFANGPVGGDQSLCRAE